MIYLVIVLSIATSSLVIFFGQKVLSNQQENHTDIMTILSELNELQFDNLKKQVAKLVAGQNSILKEFAPLYDLANTHTHIDIYLAELREENKKLKKILKRKIK